MLNLPAKVTVVDVAARDGLQSFPRWVDTETKITIVNRLSEAGFPVIEVTGYVLTVVAIAFGLLDWRFAELFFLAAIVYGSLLSVAAIALEELSFRRYPRAADLLRLAAYGVLENFGYRQLATCWRIVGVIDYFRGRKGWGTMKRKGFSRAAG